MRCFVTKFKILNTECWAYLHESADIERMKASAANVIDVTDNLQEAKTYIYTEPTYEVSEVSLQPGDPPQPEPIITPEMEECIAAAKADVDKLRSEVPKFDLLETVIQSADWVSDQWMLSNIIIDYTKK